MVGLGLMTYTVVRASVIAPDVHWDKTARSAQQPYEREAQAADGKVWIETIRSKSRWNRPGLDVGQVSVFEPWFKPNKAEGVAKVHGPAPPATL